MKQKPKDSKRVSAKKQPTKTTAEPAGVLAGPRDKTALAKIMAEIEANLAKQQANDLARRSIAPSET